MIMLSTISETGPSERFESDRESLPFPSGGVFGSATASDLPTLDPALADDIVDTIDQMQASLDTLEKALGAELARELEEQVEVAGRINTPLEGDWPPTAA